MKKNIFKIMFALCLCCIFAVVANVSTNVSAENSSVSGGETVEGVDGISLGKYVTTTTTENESEVTDYEYILRLETFTTGTVTATATTTTPADIVLVLDQSTSMMWPSTQPEDNGTDDGNIGIVDGKYELEDVSVDLDSNGTIEDDEKEQRYVWKQAESVSVTPLYGASWANGQTPSLTISGTTYYFGQTYNINVSNWDGDYADDYREAFGYLYSQSRQKVLIESVLDFIYTLDREAGHRLSIVTYHNTGITEYSLGEVVEYDEEEKNKYYQDIAAEVVSWVTYKNTAADSTDGISSSSSGSNTSNVDTTTFNLEHSTGVCFGMTIAESILAEAKYGRSNYDTVVTSTNLTAAYDGTGRTQMAVIFTDGIPTQASTSSSTLSTLLNVNDSLTDAYNMKQNGVTVFSIGMLDGVYSDLTGSSSSTTNPNKAASASNATSTYYADYSTTTTRPDATTYYVTYGSSFISSFLDLLSSNYVNSSTYISSGFPNSSGLYDVSSTATTYSITSTYNKNTTTDDEGNTVYTEYFYPIDTSDTSVNVADELNSIFETVAGEMRGSATYELDQTTQVRDVMSAEFSIPVDFVDVGSNNGAYGKCPTSNVYYYVGAGNGYYDIEVDINLYIAYCEGQDLTADVDTVGSNDSGYYDWSTYHLVYSTDDTASPEHIINSDLSVVVRTAFIDTRDDPESDDPESDVYYYSDYTDGAISYNSAGRYFYITGTDVKLTETQTVIVQGFNYNDYYVTTTDKNDGVNSTTPNDFGAKLIVEFEIKAATSTVTATGGDNVGDEVKTDEDLFIGGNGVDTNTAASGIYIYENVPGSGSMGYVSLASFPVPSSDVPIKIDLSVSDQTIYLGNSISIPDLLSIGSDGINGITNKYVDITFAIYTDSDGDDHVDTSTETPILTVYIPAGTDAADLETAENLIMPEYATSYVIVATVTPTDVGSVDSKTESSMQFNVYVLYPDIQTNSIWVDYGTPVVLREDNVVKPFDADFFTANRVSWEHVEEIYEYVDGTGDYNLNPSLAVFTYISTEGGQYKLENATDYEQEITYNLYHADGTTFTLSNSDFDNEGYLVTELGTGVYAKADSSGAYSFDYVGTGNGGHFNLTNASEAMEAVSSSDAGYYDLISIPEPNQSTPPTVIFGFTGGRDVEYTSAEYESYGAREDNEFYISSMTITSSDGYETVTRYDTPESNYEFFSVNINRFDLEISKLVEAADYDLYPQSFIFDVAFTGSAFESQQKISLSSDELVEYTNSSGASVYYKPASWVGDVAAAALYTTATDDHGDHNEVVSTYTTSRETIDYYYYVTGLHYALPETITTVDDTVYSLQYLHEDGESVMGTSLVTDVDKVVQLVMENGKTGITKTEVWIDAEGNESLSAQDGYTKYYKFTGTVVDLYCGLEITVTEDTDWSWRYKPGFEINQVTENQEAQMIADGRATIKAVYPELESGMSDEQILAAIEGYLGITFDTDYYYESSWETDSSAGDGSTTYTRTNDILALRIKSYDEYFDANGDMMTLWGINYNDYDNLDIAYYTNAVADGFINETVADGFTNETVADVTINSAKDEAVIFVSNSSYYLDYNDDRTTISGFERLTKTIDVDVNGDGYIDSDGDETFEIYTNPPASPFTIYGLDMNVINELVDDQWLSYRNWTDNEFTAQTVVIGGDE